MVMPTNSVSDSTCTDSTTGYMKSDSWSAILPGVFPSHSEKESSDMWVVSARGAQLDNIAPSPKSTSTCGRDGAFVVSLKRFSMCLLIILPVLFGVRITAGQPAAPRVAPSPVGTMSELMIKVIYPASDAVFYVTTRTPTTDVEWNVLQGQTLMVAESANLLMMPAHMRDEDRWLADAQLMRDAGQAAFKAAKGKDVKALDELNDALYQSCVTCHTHYRRNYGRRP